MLIVAKYLVPLKIRDRYIIAFYFFSTVMLMAAMMEIIARLIDRDPAFMISRKQPMTFGEIARNAASISYIVLGFIISASMYQLSISLSLVLNMCDLKDANTRKTTYNVTLFVITLGYITCAVIE